MAKTLPPRKVLLTPSRARKRDMFHGFMSDVLTSKRKFRTLNIVDDYNREAIMVKAAHTMGATRVTQILGRTIHEQGKPNCIRVDNVPEFNSKEFKD